MKANRTSRNIVEEKTGIIQMLPVVGIAVIMLYAIMFIGTYINGTIADELVNSYPTNNASGGGDWRSSLQNQTVNTLQNLTADYDDNTEIISVAAIITVLTIPLMAVIAVKKLI